MKKQLIITVLCCFLFFNRNANAQFWQTFGNNLSGGEYMGANNNLPVEFTTQGSSLFQMELQTSGNLNLFTTSNVTLTSLNAYQIGGLNMLHHNGKVTNLYLGVGAGYNSGNYSTGTGNTFVGGGLAQNVINTAKPVTGAGFRNSLASHGTFIGTEAGNYNVAADDNTFIGYNTGYNMITGSPVTGQLTTDGRNTFVGSYAGFNNTYNFNNTFIGYKSGYSNYDNQVNSNSPTFNADFNTFVGSLSGLSNTTGARNTFLGYLAGGNNLLGNDNCYTGCHTGLGTTPASSIGNRNNYYGAYAGADEISGDDNQQIGYQAGNLNSSGERNVLIGTNAGKALVGNGTPGSPKTPSTIDNDNIFIGYQAGLTYRGNSKNIIIGSGTDINANVKNSVGIGDGVNVKKDNSIIIGQNDRYIAIGMSGNNTWIPSTNLEINSATLNTGTSKNLLSGLKFTQLNNANTNVISPNPSNNVLSVDGSGNVILVPDQMSSSGGGSVSAWSGTSLDPTSTSTVQWGQDPFQVPSVSAILLHSTEIPMSGVDCSHNIYFTGGFPSSVNSSGNCNPSKQPLPNPNPANIGIGYPSLDISIPNKPILTKLNAKLDVITNATILNSTFQIPNQYCGRFINTGTNNYSSTLNYTGIYAKSDVTGLSTRAINIGGDFEANNAVNNISVRGLSTTRTNNTGTNYGAYFAGKNSYNRGIGVAGIAASNDNSNYGVVGIAPGGIDDATNFGVYGKVNCTGSSDYNYAIYGDAINCLTKTPNSYAGYFNGDVLCTTGFYGSSDSLLKTNILPIAGDSALFFLNQLNPKTYTFRQADYPSMSLASGKQYGLIAQQVERVLPTLVTTATHPPKYNDSTGAIIYPAVTYKALNYNAFIPLLIAGVKKLDNTVKTIPTNADNGLNVDAGTIQLGGDLLHNTFIDLKDKNFIFKDANLGKVGIGHETSDTLRAKLDALVIADNLCGTGTSTQTTGKFSMLGNCDSKAMLTAVQGITNVTGDNTNIGGDFSAYNGIINIGVRGTINGSESATEVTDDGIIHRGGYAVYGDAGNSANFWAGYFNGYVGTTCGWYQASDGKLKENVKPISTIQSRNIINQLHPSTYTFKTQNSSVSNLTSNIPSLNLPGGNQYGLIAEDVEKVMPELVREMSVPAKLDKNGKEISAAQSFKGVNYVGMIPVLIAALQQTDSVNNALQTKLNDLESQINSLKTTCGYTSKYPTNTGNSNSVTLGDLQIILDQNAPNPFAEQTTISYTIPESVHDAKIIFYTNNGTILKTIEISDRGAGSIVVYASNLSAGLYSYSLIADGKVVDTKKMICEKR